MSTEDTSALKCIQSIFPKRKSYSYDVYTNILLFPCISFRVRNISCGKLCSVAKLYFFNFLSCDRRIGPMLPTVSQSFYV